MQISSQDDGSACAILLQLFAAAVQSAEPARAVLSHLPEKPKGRCVVVGAGKASAAMAAAVDAAWPDVAVTGVVSTRYGHAVPAGRIRVIEAAHPVPDENSVLAAQAMLRVLAGLTTDDLVLCLMSGGASALVSAPAPSMTLEEKRYINHQLLMCGATIQEMNAVRQCLSSIKGGRLAQAAGPAPIFTLVLSDVPGDDPAIVGSGPTIPAPDAPSNARAAIRRYGLELPTHIRKMVESSSPPPPRPQDHHVVIASARQALLAAAEVSSALGYTPIILSDAIEGEGQHVGPLLATIAQSAASSFMPVRPPAVILSGGETTVSVGRDKPGRGGRNTETLLAAALKLHGNPHIWALAADTDGIDGSDEAAGAIIMPGTLARAERLSLDPWDHLARHDSGSFFRSLADQVITGPTLTNVNDFRAFLIR